MFVGECFASDNLSKKISGTFAANVSHKNEITLDRASQHNQGLFLFTLDI